MYKATFNTGHTQSRLRVYRFPVAFSFSQSLICQSLFPQVYVFLALFHFFIHPHLLSLSLAQSHTSATDLTGNSFRVFQ